MSIGDADIDALKPEIAAKIATNAYFTLKNWIHQEPIAGREARKTVVNRVLGAASVGNADHPDTSLRGAGLSNATFGGIHTAKTGFGTESGFGYTLTYEARGQRHVVIAVRGTRGEMPGIPPDLITDAHGTLRHFSGYGPVHAGFKKTFDSLKPSLDKNRNAIASANVVHCVGHSLGGAVATLVAARYAEEGKRVKLYTFGSPRVGSFHTYRALEKGIGKENIYRVAHDLDPIGLIAPFPYIHVNPSPRDTNNMTLLSPFGRLISVDNHDMGEYINSVGEGEWSEVRVASKDVDHDNALVARWLLHSDNDPGWVRHASAHTLTLLFKLFNHQLRALSTSAILGFSAVDLLAEILHKGLHMVAGFGEQILRLLGWAAQWANIKAVSAADFTAGIIRAILEKMLATLRALGMRAVSTASQNLTPMRLGVAAGWLLTGGSAL